MIALVPVLLYVMMLEFIRAYLRHFINRPSVNGGSEFPSVTVVVPYRNEIASLPGIIKALQEQKYPGPSPELIFVNDHSTDGSENAAIFPDGVRVIHLSDNLTGKKAALTGGIEAADGNWIAVTDADVILSQGWLAGLLRPAADTTVQMICGTVAISSNGSFIQDFQRMETSILQATGIASMEAGFPFLNSGASLAFRKEAWLEVGGYKDHAQIASGDDVFLMFAFHQRFPGQIIYSCETAARVLTKAVPTFRSALDQRLRWVSKMRYYRSLPVLLITLLVLSAAFTVLTAIILCRWKLALLLLCVRGFSELRLLRTSCGNQTPASLRNQLLMVIFYPFFLLLLVAGSIVYKPAWKGR